MVSKITFFLVSKTCNERETIARTLVIANTPTPESIEVSLVKEKVKERVVKDTSAIGKIYDNVVTGAFRDKTKLDLAVANGGSNDISVFLNSCSSFILSVENKFHKISRICVSVTNSEVQY